jgi:hypothetical protein
MISKGKVSMRGVPPHQWTDLGRAKQINQTVDVLRLAID